MLPFRQCTSLADTVWIVHFPEKNVCMLVLTHRRSGFVSGLRNVKPADEKKFENGNLFPLAAGSGSHYN
jgi:hypothetical protein